MRKNPVKLRAGAVRNVEKDAVEVIGPVPAANPFFTFRYSYTEISASGGKARVKSRQARWENGRLTAEAFEGDLDGTVYGQMVSAAQHYFLSQAAFFMKSLSLLLPFSRNPRSGPD